jgi:iron complex transport system substrate-binding protein
MRIVSLMPSGTELVFALGLGRSLVGVSHDSDRPADAVALPVVTRPLSPEAPVEIPSRCELDEAALVELDPDIVLAPASREVVTGRPGGLRGVLEALGADRALVTLDPTTIEGIFNTITTVGAMTGAEEAGLRLVERLRGRLGRLERRVRRRRDLGRTPSRVVALERLEPPVAAGRWIPEQVRRAGGWELLGHEGEPATASSWSAVRDLDPEAIVLMPYGLHLAEVVEAWAATPRPDGWDGIDAVRRGQVFAVDAAACFSRPGPRVIDGVALLAEVLDPDGFVEASPVGTWTPVD